MKRDCLILLFVGVLGGCVTSYDTQQSTLAIDDRVNVLKANVGNPYPECDPEKTSRRIANLSVERSERVYLQEGKLCQRSS